MCVARRARREQVSDRLYGSDPLLSEVRRCALRLRQLRFQRLRLLPQHRQLSAVCLAEGEERLLVGVLHLAPLLLEARRLRLELRLQLRRAAGGGGGGHGESMGSDVALHRSPRDIDTPVNVGHGRVAPYTETARRWAKRQVPPSEQALAGGGTAPY